MGIFARAIGEALGARQSRKRAEKQSPEITETINKLIANAEQGNVQAMTELGVKYGQGIGVGRDYDAAVYWWKKAAELGSVDAYFNLGVMYFGNVSIYYKNAYESYYWFELAGKNGRNDAWDILNTYFVRNEFTGAIEIID